MAWHQQKAALFLLVAVHAMEEGVQFADRDRRDRTAYLVLLSGQGDGLTSGALEVADSVWRCSMSILLDHIIVSARDKKTSAEFLAGILGLQVGAQYGPFVPVKTGNGVALDFMDSDDVRWQHCAFLVPEEEFDAIFARIKESGARYYAHPNGSGVGEINTRDGGRGVYFDDPSGHAMEILTVPYGGWPS